MRELGRVPAASTWKPPGTSQRRALIDHLQGLTPQKQHVFEHENRNGRFVNEHEETSDHQQGRVNQQTGEEPRPYPATVHLRGRQLVKPYNRNAQRDEIHRHDRVLQVHVGNFILKEHFHQSEAVQDVNAGAQEATLGMETRGTVGILNDGVDETVKQGRTEQHGDFKPRDAERHFQGDEIQYGRFQNEHHLRGGRDHVDEPCQVREGELPEVAAEDGAFLVETASAFSLASRVFHEEDPPSRYNHQIRGYPRAPVEIREDDEVEIQHAALEKEHEET